MTKQDFIQKVSQKSGLSARDAGKAVDAFMETVTETLKAGDTVNFTGFGKFSPSARAAFALLVRWQGQIHHPSRRAAAHLPSLSEKPRYRPSR